MGQDLLLSISIPIGQLVQCIAKTKIRSVMEQSLKLRQESPKRMGSSFFWIERQYADRISIGTDDPHSSCDGSFDTDPLLSLI